MSVNQPGVPEGYHSATPYLIIRGDADQAVAFYEQAFGATELRRSVDPSGVIRNVQIRIGDSPIMLGIREPNTIVNETQRGDLPLASIYLFVENADRTFQQAIEHGAETLYTPEDQEYGYREGGLMDPYGVTWWIATPLGGKTAE
jgi:PhnB protein